MRLKGYLNAPVRERVVRRRRVACNRRPPSLQRVEREVQPQDVYTWLPQYQQCTPCRIVGNEMTHLLNAKVASLGHARQLQGGVAWADIWIQAACGLWALTLVPVWRRLVLAPLGSLRVEPSVLW